MRDAAVTPLGRLPWEIVETFPSTDAELIAGWEDRVAAATSVADRVHALVGRALAHYWGTQEGVVTDPWETLARSRAADVAEARRLATEHGDPELRAVALLGALHALWGPDHVDERPALVAELVELRSEVRDEELRHRIREWVVLGHLDAGDLHGAETEIERFAAEASGTSLVLFRRREVLWRANLAMLRGDIDGALAINTEAISSTADVAGSPFSFQNVAITMAIERYFRRGLADFIDAIRSIRASSPRVAANWDTGLAFALGEIGELDEAAELFDRLATDRFAGVPRDLNWLVTIHLLGLVALRLDDRDRAEVLLELLGPFEQHDATHGSGYASYGPVGRVVGALAARLGDHARAERCLGEVLDTREPGPWTSLTRLDRAVARSSVDGPAALADVRRAGAELDALGLEGWAEEARTVEVGLLLEGHGEPVAVRRGDRWELRHPAGRGRVADGIGVRHLLRLLAAPGQPVDATRIAPTADPTLPSESVSESSLDRTARAAFRRRLRELAALDRPGPDELAEAEWLRRELAGAVHAPAASAELERARVRVTKALRRTLDAIAIESPSLGRHLASTVETGRRCSYVPADGTPWRIVGDHPD